MSKLLELLGADRYLPHAICLTNEPWLISVYMAAHGVTMWAYLTIGWVFMVLDRNPFNQPHLKKLTGAFIVSCGVQHGTMAATYIWGIYRLDVMMVVAMAVISAIVAVLVLQDAFSEA